MYQIPPATSNTMIMGTHRQELLPRDPLRQQMKSRSICKNVTKFVKNMKQSIIKTKPPEAVKHQLDTKQYAWVDSSGLGWDPQRLDVILVEIICSFFHFVSIFLYTARVVLFHVVEGPYPMVYIGILILSAIYKLNTQILVGSNTLVRKSQIRSHYLRWPLFLDITLIILSFLEFFKIPSGVFRLVIFFKLIELSQTHTKFQLIINGLSRRGVLLWRIINLLALNIIVAHMLGLVLISMVVQADEVPNWMTDKGLSRNDPKWTVPYLWAFYWGTTIMLTIGFGDLTPKNTREVFIVTILEMVGVIVFAYYIGTVQNMLADLRDINGKRTKNLYTVNRYMRHKYLQPGLQKQVKQLVADTSNTHLAEQIEQENSVVAGLLPVVKNRLLEAINFQKLFCMPLWNRMSSQSIKKIAVALQRKMYSNSQAVVIQGDVPNRFLIFVEGRVNFVVDGQSRESRIQTHSLEQHASWKRSKYLWVMLQQTVRGMPSKTSVLSKGSSLMLSIPVDQAASLLRESNEDYESYCLFRDRVAFSSFSFSSSKCDMCSEVGHTILDCPSSHYIPKRDIVVLKHLKDKKRHANSIGIGQRRQNSITNHRKHRKKIRWARMAKILPSQQQTAARMAMHSQLIYSFPAPEQGNIWTQITALPDVDQVHTWKIYSNKYNIPQQRPR